jgi:hypothetical protein
MTRPLVTLSCIICIALTLVVFLPATKSVQADASTLANATDAAALGKAGAYCVNRGGEVDTRAPFFNTNDNEQSWFRLSGDRQESST